MDETGGVDTDVRERMHAAGKSVVPAGAPPAEEVLRRARARRGMRMAGAATVVAMVAVALVWASISLGGLHRQSPGSVASESPPTPDASAEPALVLVPTGATLLRECRATARQVRFAVPCPRLLPEGWQPPGGGAVIESWLQTGPAHPWMILSVEFPVDTANLSANGFTHEGHLVIVASPFPVGPEKLLFPECCGEVFPAGTTRIDGVTARWYRVRCECSFNFHLALVWTLAGHSYAVGFHDWTKESRTYGLQVAQSVALIGST